MVAPEGEIAQGVEHAGVADDVHPLGDVGVMANHQVCPVVHKPFGDAPLGAVPGPGVFGAGMEDGDDDLAARFLQGLHAGAHILRVGEKIGRVGAHKAHLDALFLVDIGGGRHRDAAKPGHILGGEGIQGAAEAFFAVVHDVVVADESQFHAALRQDLGKLRGASEVVVLVCLALGLIIKDVFQVDDGEVIGGEQLLDLGKRVIKTLLPDDVHKGIGLAHEVLHVAQGAVPGEGEDDAAAFHHLGRNENRKQQHSQGCTDQHPEKTLEPHAGMVSTRPLFVKDFRLPGPFSPVQTPGICAIIGTGFWKGRQGMEFSISRRLPL